MISRSPLKKQHNFLLGVYLLAGMVSVIVLSFLFLLGQLFYSSLSTSHVSILFTQFMTMLSVAVQSVTLAIPLAAAVSYFLILKSDSKIGRSLQHLFALIRVWPLLLYGVLFGFLLIPSKLMLILVLTWVAVMHLCSTWVDLSKKVSISEIETFRSFGASYTQLIYQLYLRQYGVRYLMAVITGVIHLTLTITPVIWMASQLNDADKTLSLHFLNSLLEGKQQSVVYLMIFLLLYSLAFIAERLFWGSRNAYV